MLENKFKFIPLVRSDIPAPEKELLEYDELITLKLEKMHKQEMEIRVIEKNFSKGVYQREIIMFGKKDNIPRELAHIKIFLDNLNKDARQKVLRARKPFGKILSGCKINSQRKINRFFGVCKNNYLAKHIKPGKDFFYGRSYNIFLKRPGKKKLAEVTEIFL